MQFIPSNTLVRIAAETFFGAKSVEFALPDKPSSSTLKPNTHLQASPVSLEINTLFQSLVQTLHTIDPVKLNVTLSALSEGLRDNGEGFGATVSDLDALMGKINPRLPQLQSDLVRAGIVAQTYGDAAPDLVEVFDNTPTIAHTIQGECANLNATLMAVIGLSDNGVQQLAPAKDDLIATVQRLRAPAKVLGDYSPELGCLIQGLGAC